MLRLIDPFVLNQVACHFFEGFFQKFFLSHIYDLLAVYQWFLEGGNKPTLAAQARGGGICTLRDLVPATKSAGRGSISSSKGGTEKAAQVRHVELMQKVERSRRSVIGAINWLVVQSKHSPPTNRFDLAL